MYSVYYYIYNISALLRVQRPGYNPPGNSRHKVQRLFEFISFIDAFLRHLVLGSIPIVLLASMYVCIYAYLYYNSPYGSLCEMT